MLILIFFVILLLLSLLDFFGCRSNFLFLLASLLIILLTGFRYGAGIDYDVYYSLFYSLDEWFEPNFEPGFTIIVRCLKLLGLNEFSIFFIFALLSIIPVMWACRKFSNYPTLSLFIYFSLYLLPLNFNAISQGLTTAILLGTISLIYIKRVSVVACVSLCAATLHTSGFFIYICHVIYHLKLNHIRLWLVLLISGLCFIISPHIYRVLMELPFIGIGEKMMSYSEQYDSSVKLSSIIQRLIIIIPVLFSFKRLSDLNKGLVKIYIFSFLFYAVFSFNGLLATRINLFFKVVDVLLIPNALFLISDRYSRIFALLLLLMFSLLVLSGNFKDDFIWDLKMIFNRS